MATGAQDTVGTARASKIGRPSTPRATSNLLETTVETGREAAGIGLAGSRIAGTLVSRDEPNVSEAGAGNGVATLGLETPLAAASASTVRNSVRAL